MKINHPFTQPSLPQTTDSARTSDPLTDHIHQSGTTSLHSPVALSATARHLMQLENPSHDVSTLRVHAIRDALENGTLVINPERIAERLIADAQELLAHT